MFEKETILEEQLAAPCLFQCSVGPFDRFRASFGWDHPSHTLEFFWEFSRCPKNSRDFNQLILNSIHYAKTSNDDFANSGFISLGHNASRVREPDQLFNRREDARDGQTCIMLRIFGDVFVDSVKIAQRLWRPQDAHYSPKRCLA